MHIQEGTITTLTTCTKMTEEVDRRHGLNGNSSKGVNEDASVHNSAHTATGGRLKFFKDGKFILELVRGCAREGERAGWVSVPRKTFWPPAAPPPPTPPAPAPAPLSVSDDNSSLHSSPWQRDHCWKQLNPRKNISKELALYYCRPNSLHSTSIQMGSRAKRRRPYDTSHLDTISNGFGRSLSNGIYDRKRNQDAESSESKNTKSEDTVDGSVSTDASKIRATTDDNRWSDFDKKKYYHMKLKKPYQYHKLRVYKKSRPNVKRKELIKVIDKLHDKIVLLPAPVNAKLATCRQEHMIVSPRKRILRELERVSLEDQVMKRRAKTVPALSTASYPPSPGPSHVTHKPSETVTSRALNGSAPRKDITPMSKNVSSYSIHSLLSMPDDSPTRRSPEAKRSPHSYPPSLKTESPSSIHSPDLSPSPDSYRYRYSALTLGSPGPVAHESPPPPPDLARYRAGYAAPTSPYGRQWLPGGGTSQFRPPARDEYGYMYGYGYAPLYRAPTPLWMQYTVGAPLPPGPWAPLAHPLLTDHIPKDEHSSDLPLNLSKH